jgi:hypothetical protein
MQNPASRSLTSLGRYHSSDGKSGFGRVATQPSENARTKSARVMAGFPQDYPQQWKWSEGTISYESVGPNTPPCGASR